VETIPNDRINAKIILCPNKGLDLHIIVKDVQEIGVKIRI
jgi:hypothetical protein